MDGAKVDTRRPEEELVQKSEQDMMIAWTMVWEKG
jgi:hypothetical protein